MKGIYKNNSCCSTIFLFSQSEICSFFILQRLLSILVVRASLSYIQLISIIATICSKTFFFFINLLLCEIENTQIGRNPLGSPELQVFIIHIRFRSDTLFDPLVRLILRPLSILRGSTSDVSLFINASRFKIFSNPPYI